MSKKSASEPVTDRRDNPLTTMRAVVRGRVQGVGFRYATADRARRSGLVGTVRNVVDGSVEVVAQGPRAVVQAFVAWLRHGPDAARVDDLDVQWLTVSSARQWRDFRIV